MLAGVLQIGRQLGVKTIVEGVERADVRDLVAMFGADMAQGYFFGHPEPFDAVVERLSAAATRAG
jgi:EAL domain-containing protein (putative c-di-GMP-specific phosphodiesterase class I)